VLNKIKRTEYMARKAQKKQSSMGELLEAMPGEIIEQILANDIQLAVQMTMIDPATNPKLSQEANRAVHMLIMKHDPEAVAFTLTRKTPKYLQDAAKEALSALAPEFSALAKTTVTKVLKSIISYIRLVSDAGGPKAFEPYFSLQFTYVNPQYPSVKHVWAIMGGSNKPKHTLASFRDGREDNTSIMSYAAHSPSRNVLEFINFFMRSYRIFKAQDSILSEIAIYHYGLPDDDDDDDDDEYQKTRVSTF
jgi:hypothetical protein